MMSEMKNVATHGCSAICRVSGGLLVGSKVTLSDWSQGALGEIGGCNKGVSATKYLRQKATTITLGKLARHTDENLVSRDVLGGVVHHWHSLQMSFIDHP